MILAGWLALSLNLIPFTVLHGAVNPSEDEIWIYRGPGTMNQTVTTHYGNKATATCRRLTEIEVTFYADRSVKLILTHEPFFHFSIGNPNPILGLPQTHGNVECHDLDFPTPDSYYLATDTYHGDYTGSWLSVNTREENITGTFNEETLSGELEFTGIYSKTGQDGSNLEYTHTKSLEFKIPIRYRKTDYLVKGTLRDWEGNPLQKVIRWVESDDVDGIHSVTTDEDGNFEFNARTTNRITFYTSRFGGFHPTIKLVDPPDEAVELTLIPKTVGVEYGMLISTFGDVEVEISESGQWKKATAGMILDIGSRLRTGDDGQAHLSIPGDRGVAWVEQNSGIEITETGTEFDPGLKNIFKMIKQLLGTTYYHFYPGGIFSKGLIRPGPRYNVNTPEAIIGTMGTEFGIEVSEDGDVISLAEGRVQVQPKASPATTIMVETGERLLVSGANTELQRLNEEEFTQLKSQFRFLERLAHPALEIDFESTQQMQSWTDDGSDSWNLSDGIYVMTGTRTGIVTYSYFLEELRDHTFEVDLRKIEGNSPGAFTEYGMRFRSDGTADNYYQFAITTDGFYSVGKMVAGVFTPLIGWTRSEALNLGHGAWNRLKAVAQGVELSFYGNGELLNRVEDSSLSSGKAGLFAKDGASSQPRDTVQFDNVTLAQADASSAGGSDDLSLVFSDSFERASLGDQWLSGAEPGNEKLIQIVDGHVETRANLNYIETEQSFGGDLRIEVDVEKTGNEDWWCFDFWIELVALEKKGAIRFDTQAGKVGINIGGLGLVCGDASQMDAGTLNRGKAILEYTAPNLQFSFINTDGEVLTAETLQVGEFDSSKIRIWLGGQADTPRSVDNVRVYSSSSAGKPPSISSIGDQLIEAGTITQAIAFTVGDAETAASNLAVTGSSSNTQLVSEAGISLGGSGANRTVTITPTTGQTGASTITIKVTDEHGLPAETSFVLTVNAVPTGTGALLFSDSFDRSSLGDQWLSGTELGYENTVRIVDGKVEVRTNFNYIETQQSFGGDLRVEVDVERAGPSSWQCFDFQVQLGAVEQRGFIRFDWAGTDAINIGAAGICGDRYSMDSGAPNKGTAILEYKSPNLQFSFLSDNGNRLITEELAVGEFESSKVRILLGAHADTPRYVDEVRVYSSGSNGETGPQSPQITGQPQSVTVTSGETVEFRVTASGTIPLSYQWKHNGQPIVGATSARLQLSSVGAADAGEYTVVVGNAGGDVESQGGVLTVQTQPSGGLPGSCAPLPSGLVSWWPAEFSREDIRGNRPGTLHGATFTSGKVGRGAFSFNGNDAFVSTELDTQPSAMPETTWEAWVRPHRLNHGFKQQILSTDDGGFDRSILIDEEKQFGVFTGNGVWKPTEATLNEWQHIAVVFTQNDIHLYKNGIEFSWGSPPIGQETGQKLTIGASPGFGEFFQGAIDEVSVYNRALSVGEIKAIFEADIEGKCPPGEGGMPPSISSIADQSIEAGTFTGAISFTVSDAETPASNLTVTGSSSDTRLVSESGISLGGSGTNRTVTITPATGQTGASTITIKVTDEHGMLAETSFVLTVRPSTVVKPPQITGQPLTQSVTAGEAVEFRVVASGTSPLSYQWKHNGRPLPGATSAILQLSSVSMVDAGEYTVVVSNAAGQVESQGAVLTVRSQPSGSSFALRRLPSGYIGRTQLTVSIEAAPPNRALAYGLEDQQPAGWTISDIDSGGAHDTVSGKIKWTFLDNNPRTLTYRVTPPAGTSGVQCFSGIGNVNGTDENPIGGDQCIELAQQHPADLEPSDWSLSLSEVLKYAAAYKRGDVWSMNPNPIPLDYVIRGLVLYKSGEQYRIDESIGSAPGWWVTDVIRLASPRFSRATVLNVGSSAISELPHEYTSGVPFMVTIRVTPAQGGVAYGVEDQPPAGWSVSAINESGEYDAVNHKVKWTFLDNQARSLSYEVTSPQDTQGSATFTGMVSFDGAVNKAIEGNRSTTTTTASPPQISITIDVSGNIVLTFDGELHSASEVTGPYAEVPGAVSPLTVNPAPMSRFYRAVRQ